MNAPFLYECNEAITDRNIVSKFNMDIMSTIWTYRGKYRDNRLLFYVYIKAEKTDEEERERRG